MIWNMADASQRKCFSKHYSHNHIIIVRQFDLLKKINNRRQAILTSPLLFSRGTVGSPAPPPLWLVGWLESDSNERNVLSKVEHSSTLGANKKRPSAQREKDAQRSARSCHFKKRGAPIENKWKNTPASGNKCFGGQIVTFLLWIASLGYILQFWVYNTLLRLYVSQFRDFFLNCVKKS